MALPQTKIAPLAFNVPIVYKETGYPTPYFQQMLVQWFTEKKVNDTATDVAATTALWGGITGTLSLQVDLQTALDAKADETITVTGASGITGGGDLTSNRVLSASVQAILDQISTTRGVILYRGATGWTALAPGAAGTKLTSNGAGTDPTWV
jgi:hypothetical protein